MGIISYNPYNRETIYRTAGYADVNNDKPVADDDLTINEIFSDVVNKTLHEFVDCFLHFEGDDAVDPLLIRIYKREDETFGGGIGEAEDYIREVVITGPEHGGNKIMRLMHLTVEDGTGYFRIGVTGGSTTTFDVKIVIARRSRVIV